jgi:hypothetical protein
MALMMPVRRLRPLSHHSRMEILLGGGQFFMHLPAK